MNLFARREAKTRNQQRDWLTKRQTFSPTNHVAEFLFAIRVAQANSPSGKPAQVLFCAVRDQLCVYSCPNMLKNAVTCSNKHDVATRRSIMH